MKDRTRIAYPRRNRFAPANLVHLSADADAILRRLSEQHGMSRQEVVEGLILGHAALNPLKALHGLSDSEAAAYREMGP